MRSPYNARLSCKKITVKRMHGVSSQRTSPVRKGIASNKCKPPGIDCVNGLLPEEHHLVWGRYARHRYDNPDITPYHKCRYYACVTVPDQIPSDETVRIMDIAAGRYATYRFRGRPRKAFKRHSDGSTLNGCRTAVTNQRIPRVMNSTTRPLKLVTKKSTASTSACRLNHYKKQDLQNDSQDLERQNSLDRLCWLS